MVNKINASHILVSTEQDAKKVLYDLNHGENFEDIAKERSNCPSSKDGGNLGWFGKGQMVKEFEDACFNSKKGKIIGPIKTQFGYHIIKIIDMK